MFSSQATLRTAIESGGLDKTFRTLYPGEETDWQKQRYMRLLDSLDNKYLGDKSMFISSPGRTELCGNHTDHNNGCVVAGAVTLDCVAFVGPLDNQEIVLHSHDYPRVIRVDLQDLAPNTTEQNSPESLVRGVAAEIKKLTGVSQGFWGYLHATCLPGTGLSSSAAFSVLVGAALNFLYLDGKLSAQQLAAIAQRAENDYFGKPCGLMDQMASALGQTVCIDFKTPESPQIQKIEQSLNETDYQLAIIDTGGSHIELTSEYAAIPAEMNQAAKLLGKDSARKVHYTDLWNNISTLREEAGDRAVLRLLHFIDENRRAQEMAQSLADSDWHNYLQLVKQSGESSCNLLQNCASSATSKEQGILLALALAKNICPSAVCRVHGGGFAGTVQAYIPKQHVSQFSASMEHVFGKNCVIPLYLGRPGVCSISDTGIALPDPG